MASTPSVTTLPPNGMINSGSTKIIEAITDAAMQVLLDEGVRRLTIRRIAKQAGISVRALYRYFPNLQSVLNALYQGQMSSRADAFEAACNPLHGQTLLTVCEGLVAGYADPLIREPSESLALYKLGDALETDVLRNSFTTRLVKNCRRVLHAAADASFDDLQSVAFTLITSMDGSIRTMVEAEVPAQQLPKLRDQIMHLCRGYLYQVAMPKELTDSSPEMLAHMEIFRRVTNQVYPVVLRSEDEEYPYHGVGTAFILEHENQLYVVSAQHVLDSQQASSQDFTLMIREAAYSVVFDWEAVFQTDYAPHSDLLIRRIAPAQREHLIDLGMYWVGTEFAIDPKYYPEVKVFYVFGFSEDDREYDYEKKRIKANLTFVSAQLAEPAMPEMVTIKLEEECPRSLRGFSGSMVVAVIEDSWMFAGMLTLASETTGMMNFIPAAQIVYYLRDLAEKHRTGALHIDTPSPSEQH